MNMTKKNEVCFVCGTPGAGTLGLSFFPLHGYDEITIIPKGDNEKNYHETQEGDYEKVILSTCYYLFYSLPMPWP